MQNETTMLPGDTHRIDVQDVVNYVIMGAFAPIMRRDKISLFHQRQQDIAPVIRAIVIDLLLRQWGGESGGRVFPEGRLPRRHTANVGTTTEDILVKMERCLRKDGIETFALEVDDIRPVVRALVVELFAEQAAYLANQDSMVA